MATKPVTMATDTVTMATKAWMVTMGEDKMAVPPARRGLGAQAYSTDPPPPLRGGGGGGVDFTTFYDKWF